MSPDKMSATERFETSSPFPPDGTGENYPPSIPAELTEEERQQADDLRWALFDPELQQRYPDKIVAVYHRKIVAVGEDWGKVLEEAERITGAPGNHIAVVAILGPSILEL